MFHLDEPVPCLNNEPYYDGLKWGNTADQGSDLAAYYSRVALYGSVLSGALAGHVYGAHHIWAGDDEMSQAFLIQSAPQMKHIREFLLSEGRAYQDLIPAKELLEPNQTPNEDQRMGWAYCLRSEAKDLFLLYFESGCEKPMICATLPAAEYLAHWFDTITGTWIETEPLESDGDGRLTMSDFPDGSSTSKRDWALKLKVMPSQESAE
jgi:hypothetical protein